MYFELCFEDGFRKVSHIEHGIKDEADDLEFQHQFFQRGQEHLLERIKRKIAGVYLNLPEICIYM